MEKENPNYYTVIPAEIRYDDRLPDKAKLLYGEITALADKNGYCWATNGYFANLYKTAPETVSRYINKLVTCGYIKSEMIYKSGSKEIEKRLLKIVHPIDKNVDTPCSNCQKGVDEIIKGGIDENIKENNTSINNTSINNTNNTNVLLDTRARVGKSKFKSPKLEEVIAYCKEKNFVTEPKEFYDYFEAGNWVDSRGNKVKNWKQKLLTWEKFKKLESANTEAKYGAPTKPEFDLKQKEGESNQEYLTRYFTEKMKFERRE